MQNPNARSDMAPGQNAAAVALLRNQRVQPQDSVVDEQDVAVQRKAERREARGRTGACLLPSALVYRTIPVRRKQKAFVDLDFAAQMTSTIFSGLENLAPNSYCNALLQVCACCHVHLNRWHRRCSLLVQVHIHHQVLHRQRWVQQICSSTSACGKVSQATHGTVLTSIGVRAAAPYRFEKLFIAMGMLWASHVIKAVCLLVCLAAESLWYPRACVRSRRCTSSQTFATTCCDTRPTPTTRPRCWTSCASCSRCSSSHAASPAKRPTCCACYGTCRKLRQLACWRRRCAELLQLPVVLLWGVST